MAQIADNWEATRAAYAATRQQHYFSAEFLQGRALLNNLTNLDLVDEAKAAAKQGGRELSTSSKPSTMRPSATVALAAWQRASLTPRSRRITR